MAVAYVGTASSTNATATPVTLTSHTVPSGSDLCLVVEVGFDNRNTQTVSGITWNGSENLTKVRSDEATTCKKSRTEIWRLLNPTVTTANVVATFTGTDSGKPYALGAFTLSGVHQTTPVTGTGVGNSSEADTGPATVTVPAGATTSIVASATANYKGSANTPTGSTVNRWTNGTSGTEWVSGETTPGSASAINLSTTLTGNSSSWSISAAEFLEAGVAGVQFEQVEFRGRNDDGSETAATWKAAENTNFNQLVDTNFRIRFNLQELNDVVEADVALKLQYNKNSAGWNDVNAASTNVRSSASPNVADAADTTEQMAGTGTFVTPNAGFDEVNGAVGGTPLDFSATVNQDVEVEFCVQIRGVDVAINDTIQLRVVLSDGTAFTTYTQTPTVTVKEAQFEQVEFRIRNDDGNETAATWRAAENTNWLQVVDTNARIRFNLQELLDLPELNVGLKLQYNKNSAGWNDVNAASTNVRSTASPNVVDGISTTEQMAGTGTFVTPNGGFDEVDGAVGGALFDLSTTVNEDVEVEFCFQVRNIDTAVDDTIQLRVVLNDGVVLTTYTQTPTMTVKDVLYHLTGTTRDESLAVLANCRCVLMKRDNVAEAVRVYTKITEVNSNGSGVYDFPDLGDNDALYIVVAYDDQTNDARGATDDTLQPITQ